MSNQVIDQLIDLEKILLTHSCRKNAGRVATLLHDDFMEIGKSGRQFDKARIIQSLAGEDSTPIYSDGFKGTVLSDTLILISYRTSMDPSFATGALRTSLWQKGDDNMGIDGWQIRHHQGTPFVQ